jgi:dihydroneopterin aldolase
MSDDLKDTVDYVLLNKIVLEEMEIRSHLLNMWHKDITRFLIVKFRSFQNTFRLFLNLNPLLVVMLNPLLLEE